jgi:putative membrane protein insertion efficiency factor
MQPSIPSRILIWMIYVYQWLTANAPPVCRFQPSCSAYAQQAIAKHGCIKGGWLAIRRVARCHPFSRGGYDPVS